MGEQDDKRKPLSLTAPEGLVKRQDYLERVLAGLLDEVCKHPNDKKLLVYNAFKALAVTAWDIDQKRPDYPLADTVALPFWAVSAIAERWITYERDGVSGQSMGEAFGLEGRGQGRQPFRRIRDTADVERELALRVAARRLAGPGRMRLTIERCCLEVAGNTGFTVRKVRTAWQHHGPAAKVKLGADSVCRQRLRDRPG
jgi:hypothetical protein